MAEETLVVLKRRELANSWQIGPFVETGGYQALRKALTEMTPQEVIEVVQASGLRGRGGAGMGTGLKWSSSRRTRRRRATSCATVTKGSRARSTTAN